MAYCTKADITGLGEEFTIPDAFTDADIDQVIADVTNVINKYTGDNFNLVSQALIFDGPGKHTLHLTRKTPLRLLSITQIQYRDAYKSTDNFDADGSVLNADTYVPYSHYVERYENDEVRNSASNVLVTNMFGETIAKGAIWLKGSKNYKITGTWGHSSVPKGIKWITVMMARERITPGSTAQYAMKQSERWIDYSYSTPYPGLIPVVTGIQAVDQILPQYINRVPALRKC